MNLKRVIFISNHLIPCPDAGGGSVVVYRHLKKLSDKGIAVLVVIIGSTINKKPAFETVTIPKQWWYPPLRKYTPGMTSLRMKIVTEDLSRKVHFQSGDVVLGVLGEVSNLTMLSLKRIYNIPYTLLYHDDVFFNRYKKLQILSKTHFERLMTEANGVLAVSEPLLNLLRQHGIYKSELLYPIPEDSFSEEHKVITQAKTQPTFCVSGMIEPIHFPVIQNMILAAKKSNSKFEIIGEVQANAGFDAEIQIHPKFSTVKGLINYFRASARIPIVFYSFDEYHEPRMFSSFPSKLVEYCHAGLPILIVAPPSSTLGKWAARNNWAGYHSSDNVQAIAACMSKYHDPAFVESCHQQAVEAAGNDFNPERLQNILEYYLDAQDDA